MIKNWRQPNGPSTALSLISNTLADFSLVKTTTIATTQPSGRVKALSLKKRASHPKWFHFRNDICFIWLESKKKKNEWTDGNGTTIVPFYNQKLELSGNCRKEIVFGNEMSKEQRRDEIEREYEIERESWPIYIALCSFHFGRPSQKMQSKNLPEIILNKHLLITTQFIIN